MILENLSLLYFKNYEEADIRAKVNESVEFAESSPYPTVDELYKDIYMQEDYPYIQD